MTNLSYLFAAYAAIWLGIFLYCLRLGRRNRDLEEEIREIRRLIGA